MKNTLKKYSVLIVVLVMVAMMTITPNINADESTTGSLKIICREQPNGEATNTPIKNVNFAIIKVNEDTQTVEDAKTFISENPTVYPRYGTTDENGELLFNNLEEGRYYVYLPQRTTNNTNFGNFDYTNGLYVETPTHFEEFLVDIPTTNAEGTNLDYNVVVEPKVTIAYGNLEIVKTDMEGNPLQGVEFKVDPISQLSISDDGTSSSYASSSTDKSITLTTDENGKITLNNLKYYGGTDSNGRKLYCGYVITEENNPVDDYIVNSSPAGLRIICFVDENGVVITNYTEGKRFGSARRGGSKFLVSVKEDGHNTIVNVKNQKLNITKKVVNKNNELVDSIGANMKDVITFKSVIDVPVLLNGIKTYKFKDELPSGLVLDRDSIVIEGTTSEGFETISEEAYTLSEEGLEIIFNPLKLRVTEGENRYSSKYNSIIITYSVKLDKDNMVIGGNGNINTASLTYSNYISSDNKEISTKTVLDTAEVHTGAIKIEKTDKLDANVKLAGAKFKIATSEANAKAGVFVTDENGVDIEVTTDAQGQAMIKGLAYADNGSDVSYWLVETQAPKYTEEVDGVEVEKSYNLLKNPVEAKVGKTTHNTAVKIKNGKGLNLPATGGIGIIIFALAGIGIMTVSVILNKKKQVIER